MADSHQTQPVAVHYYHEVTGEYLGSSPLILSPEDGAPVVPDHTTLKPPPETVQEAHRAVFENDAWTQKIDQRDRAYWMPDGSHGVIEELGQAVPSGALDAPPMPPPTASDIQAEAERRIDAGTIIEGIVFRTDDATMIRLRGLLDAFDAGLVPERGVSYRTRAGVLVSFKDRATAERFYNGANQYRSTVLEASARLQALLPGDFFENDHWDPAGQLVR